MVQLTFFFDRTFGTRLPSVLAKMKPPVRVKWHQEQGFPHKMPDDEWMGVIGPRNWIAISQDRKWHLLENELAAVRQHELGCFYLPSVNRWESLIQMVTRCERMVRLTNETPRPFIYELKGNGRLYRVQI